MVQPFANDHSVGTTSCKWSSGWTGLLTMIILIDRPLTNDHPDGPASCKWSSFSPPLVFSSAKKTYFSSPNIFLFFLLYNFQIYSSFFFPSFVLFWKNIISFSKYNLPFPSPFYFSSAKNNSFSKYHPPFPSLFIFSCKDPKLKILVSWGKILIIYLVS